MIDLLLIRITIDVSLPSDLDFAVQKRGSVDPVTDVGTIISVEIKAEEVVVITISSTEVSAVRRCTNGHNARTPCSGCSERLHY